MQKSLRKLLAIDTSTAAMTVALMDGNELWGEMTEIVDRDHSTKLHPVIHDLLTSKGITIKELDSIAVGRGPGSYTGVRIGVTFAKTLAWTMQIPLIGISSLEALAYSALSLEDQDRKRWIIPTMNARRDQAYTSLYIAKKDHWKCGIKDGIRPMAKWIEDLVLALKKTNKEEQPDEILFVGENEAFLSPFLSPLSRFFADEVHMIKQNMRAYDIGRLAQQRWKSGEQEDIHTFIPNYAQITEAEANLDKGKQGEKT